MGTGCAVHVNRLEVRATDGKIQRLTLTENTKVVKGRTAVKASEIQPGFRVVASATETKLKDGTTALIANRIQLGMAAQATEPCALE